MDSSTDQSLPTKNIFDQIAEEDLQRQKSIEKLNQNYAALHSTRRNTRSIEKQPFLKLINLNLSFAQIGTIAQLLRSILSGFTGSTNTNDPNTTKTRSLDIADDLLHKLRQQSQYSIHAQPVLNAQEPDDISSDLVTNMLTNKLGRNVYKFHAFIAPWIGTAKAFFPYSINPLTGLLPRLIDSADNIMGKLTNIFWNLRQISKAFVAYDGKIKSSALTDKDNKIEEVMGFYWNHYIQKYLDLLYRSLFKSHNQMSSINLNQIITNETEQRIHGIQNEMWHNFKNNFKSIISQTYDSTNNDGMQKRIGEEEPQNQKWYVRMKIINKCLGLPIGLFGAISNTASIGLNVIGSIFNSQRIRGLSEEYTDWANALMSIVYLTKEVPANLHEYIRKKTYEGETNKRNLYVFFVGVLGMLNRIKILPVFKQLLDLIKVKPLLDKFDNVLKHFFLLFFSYNRIVLHSTEKAKSKVNASHQDLKESSRHDNLRSHLSLPIRVLMADEQVSYSNKSLNPSNDFIPTVTN